MALSTRAWNYLGSIRVGEAKNRPTLIAGLGGKSVLEELVRTGHLKPQGGRFGRTPASERAFTLFDALPADGSSMGNARAKTASDLTDKQFVAAKSILLKTGEIGRGRGRGGSIRRLANVDIGSRAGAVERESDMYEPFRRWLEDQEQQAGECFTFHHVSAHGSSQRRSTGQWSKPDVVSVVVTDLPMLPSVDVTVSTYELKPLTHARSLAGVYEASAHQRRANFASLVIEWPLDDEFEAPAEVIAECRRLGVGLIRMWGRNAEPILEPVRQIPSPSELNDFLSDALTAEITPGYLEAIGQGAELEESGDGV